MQFKTVALASLATMAAAQRPNGTSICDYYTTALLKENTAANQETLLTLVVNTAVIGNYTKPNVGIAVPGILNPKASFNGTAVNLVPYFTGALASSNRGGSAGVSINFLDGGAATPLLANKPADSESSNQYKLLTHLYEYFGAVLGCSGYGSADFAAYTGHTSMYEVHKFMALDNAEINYFIQQVGLSAASFGVATADVEIVGKALTDLFAYRCAPATSVLPKEAPELQSICIAEDCPVAVNSTCSAYATVVKPLAVNGTATNGTTPKASGTGMPTSTPTSTVAPFKGAASAMTVALGPIAVAFAVLGYML